MLNSQQKIAIYMEQNLDSDYGKMGFGVMRYSANPVCCVIDSAHQGKRVNEVCGAIGSDINGAPFDYPVVATMQQAADLGAQVLVLGVAPSGGIMPPQWEAPLGECLRLGMCIVNGMHDQLNARFGHLLRDRQWIWDVRQPTFTPDIAAARAAQLNNKRVLLVGTDMACGKMTAGLEIHHWLRAHGHDSAFLATGQIGITITGSGIPLDAFKLDHACGAVEHMVMEAAAHSIVIIEGQGSLLHPGSSATLSLLRGSCATHLIMCHHAGATCLRTPTFVRIPPLVDVIHLNESVAGACGVLTPATTIGIALNTAQLNESEARHEIDKLERETNLPVTDVVRHDASKIAALLVGD